MIDGLNVNQAFDETMKSVRETLLRAPGSVKEVTEHLAGSLGKGIRIRLLMTCAMDVNGRVTEDAVKAAAAIELLHMATLVHDDIIDEAFVRRNIPTVHSKFGNEKAVLCGDWLLCAALKQAALMELPHKEEGSRNHSRNLALTFIKAAEKLCLGELEERNNIGNVEMSPRRYLRIIDGKTAALFCLSARVGAMIGDSSERDTNQLVKFARYLGYVFQIIDDIKDYSAEESSTLKTVKNDLMSGVVTMPAILGFLKEPSLKKTAAEVMRTGLGIETFIKRLHEIKGIQDAMDICSRYADKARAILKEPSLEFRRMALLGLLDTSFDAIMIKV